MVLPDRLTVGEAQRYLFKLHEQMAYFLVKAERIGFLLSGADQRVTVKLNVYPREAL